MPYFNASFLNHLFLYQFHTKLCSISHSSGHHFDQFLLCQVYRREMEDLDHCSFCLPCFLFQLAAVEHLQLLPSITMKRSRASSCDGCSIVVTDKRYHRKSSCLSDYLDSCRVVFNHCMETRDNVKRDLISIDL